MSLDILNYARGQTIPVLVSNLNFFTSKEETLNVTVVGVGVGVGRDGETVRVTDTIL